MVRAGVLRWFQISSVALGLLGVSSCLISFDHYAEGDVCGAGRDAGLRPRTAPDPVLRGCEAGVEIEPEPMPMPEASAGASGAEDSP